MTMNRLLFQFFRHSSSLLSTTAPILTTTIVNRTYSSGAPKMRRTKVVRRHNTVPRFPEPPFPLRELHEQIESLIDDKNDHKAASRTLTDAVISGTIPMSGTCHCVLQSMCDAGLYEDAISLFNFLYNDNKDSKLKPPDIDSYNCLISAHIGSGRVDQALQVYLSIRQSIGRDDKAFSSRLFSPHFRYAALIKALVEGNGISDAVGILRDMLAPNVRQVEAKAFNYIISGYLQLNDVESAYKLFDEFVEIKRRRCHWGDGVVFATLMDHYFKNNMEKQAMQLYQDFLGWRVRMNADTYNAMLEVFLKYGKLAEAESIFKGIIGFNGPPNLATFRILFDAYNEQNRIDDLSKWLNYMLFKTDLEPKSELLDSVLSKLINKGRTEEVVEILEKIPVGTVKTFPVSSYEIILAELCTEGKVDKVSDLLRIKEKHNISITAMLHGIIYEAFANAKKTDQIEEMLGMPILAICANPREAHVFQHSSTMPL